MNITSKKIAIKATAANISSTKIKNLALQLQLPIIEENISTDKYEFVLEFINNRLQLQETSLKKSNPIFVDFFSNQSIHRHKHGGSFGQLIAKASGVKKSNAETLKILDVTAGLGIDAFVLACLGCDIHIIERSPIIGALLEDGLERAKTNPAFAKIKLKLTIMDSVEYLTNISKKNRPDIIYLDPMYPERKKTALGKKAMRILKEIVGEDLDAAKLLTLALESALKRIVVKRPKLAPAIGNKIPNLFFAGKSCRYDIYFPHTPR